LSVHIRGPIWLTQFAVYKPGSTSQNRPRSKHGSHARRHQAHHYGHGHDHHGHANEINEHEIGKRSVGQLISATIDGQVVSWTNAYAGPGVASSLPSPVGVHMDEANGPAPDSSTQNFETLEATSPSSSVVETSPATTHFPTTTLRFSPKSTSKTSPEPVASGNWIRRAYYDAAGGIAQGVTFLNHFGGTDGIPGTAAGGPASVQPHFYIYM